MTARHYELKCQKCGARFNDDGFLLGCTAGHEAALLTTEYAERQFSADKEAEGIFRYRAWLPARRQLSGTARTVTYQSARLSRVTELANLWVAFNGYWPE